MKDAPESLAPMTTRPAPASASPTRDRAAAVDDAGTATRSAAVPTAGGRGPGDLLVPVGAALFGAGVLAIAVVVGLFLATGGEVPTALSLACALAPLGLGLALLGLVRQGRAASREARRQRTERRARRDQA